MMDTRKAESTGSVSHKPRRWRRAVVATSVLGAMVLSGLSMAPMAVMQSSHRDSVLNAEFSKFGLTAKSGSGAGGWLSPLVFHDVVITDAAGQVHCTMESLRMSKSLLSILSGGSDLGTVTIVRPSLQVALDENGDLHLPPFQADQSAGWDLAFDIQDSAFVLSVPWRHLPIVDVAGIDVNGAIRTAADGRWLSVSPITVFNHEPLSESHSEQNLALVAPVLSQSTRLAGDVSLHLEAFRIRLGEETSLFDPPLQGTATFHSVEARLKEDWTRQIAQLLGGLAGTPDSSRLQIARESTIGFGIDDRGIHHQGLAFLLPELVGSLTIESSGLVGLDESLDLSLGVQLPRVFPRGAVMSTLAKMISRPLQLKVKGTVSDPQLITPPAASIADQLSRNLTPQDQARSPDMSTSIFRLIGSATSPNPSQASDGIAGGVLNIIRAAQDAKKDDPPRERPKKERRAARRARGNR